MPTVSKEPHAQTVEIQRHESQLKILEQIEKAKQLINSLPADTTVEVVSIGPYSFDVWPGLDSFRKLFAGETVERDDITLRAKRDGVRFATHDFDLPKPVPYSEVTLPEWSEV